jgi:hypothetical protein
MSGELDALWYVLWGFGGLFFGGVSTIILMAFADNRTKVKILNMITGNRFFLLKVLTDKGNISTKVGNKNETKIELFSLWFPIKPADFIYEDGVPILQYHHDNCITTVNWRPYEERRTQFYIPSAVAFRTTIDFPGVKKGETVSKEVEGYMTAEQFKPVQLPPTEVTSINEKNETVKTLKPTPLWLMVDEKVVRYASLVTPSEFAQMIRCNEAEMETNSLFMKIKQLENVLKWIQIMCIGLVLVIVLTGLALFWLNQTNGSVGAMGANLNAMNATIGELAAKNITVSCGPTLITP